MGAFLHELCLASAIIVALGIAGGFVLLPFHGRLRFGLLAAPLAGLLCVVIGTSALYSAVGLPLRACGAIAVAACMAATLAGLALVRPQWRRGDVLWSLAAFLVVAPPITFATEATTIRLGQPALLYMDGTDHLGYAQLADWLTAHPADEPPAFRPAAPYQAFPEILFRRDPRFGSFFALALVAIVRRSAGAFAYDPACAVALTIGILGVAGAFARRSPLALFVIVAGLLTSHWYDFSRDGYFGKLLAYPGVLLVSGLFLSAADDEFPPVRVAALAVLVAGTALMHSGVATALFLATLPGACVACRVLIGTFVGPPAARLRAAGPAAATLALLIFVAVVTSGVLARPMRVAFPDWHLRWSYILPRILDLENQGVALTGFTPDGLARLTIAGFGLWAALALLAVVARNADAAGLLLGPGLLLAGLAAAGQRAATLQMIGTFYPFAICAAALLIDAGSAGPTPRGVWHPALHWVALALAVAAIALRLPRGGGALRRYAGPHVPRSLQYSRADADRLANRIGRDCVEVDLDEPNPAEFVLVELGRRGIELRWGAKAWDIVAGYTKESPPAYATPARYVLVDRSKARAATRPVAERTPQFDLLDRGR